MLYDFRVRDPETARNMAIGLESILFTGATSGSTTPTSIKSYAIAASVGVYLVRTPVYSETVPIPTLTEDQTRQAILSFRPTTDILTAGRAGIADTQFSRARRLPRTNVCTSRIVTTFARSKGTQRWRSF